MPTAKDKRIAALEKAAGSIARRGRRPGQFTLDGFCFLLVELCGTDARELVGAVFDRRPLPGRERLCEAVSRALCAVLGREREAYRAACVDLRAAAEAEAAVRTVLESGSEIPKLVERGAVAPVPRGTGPVAPPAAVGERLLAEVDSLPDTILSDAEVEEARRLPGEAPAWPEGVPRHLDNTGWVRPEEDWNRG